MRISDWSSDVCSSDLSAHDRSVERGRQRGMHEVQQVRRGGPQALDSVPVECVDRLQHACLVVAALAFVQEAAEGALMLGVLVDIRDAPLGFPQERVGGALEYLPLLGHGGQI